MLDTRDWFATVVVRDSIYLIGGVLWEELAFECLAGVNVYDPREDTWSDLPAMPTLLLPQGQRRSTEGFMFSEAQEMLEKMWNYSRCCGM